MPHPVQRVTKPLILIHGNINIDRIMVLHPLSICVWEKISLIVKRFHTAFISLGFKISHRASVSALGVQDSGILAVVVVFWSSDGPH